MKISVLPPNACSSATSRCGRYAIVSVQEKPDAAAKMKSSTPVSAAVSSTVRAKLAEAHLAIEQHRQRQPVEHREGRDLGRRGDAEQNAAEQHRRHEQRQNRAEPGPRHRPQWRARHTRRAGAAGAHIDQHHQAERHHAPPGCRPPMNMAPTDTLVIEPTISMAMLGGTVSPMIAEAASTAAPSAAP